jgi:hypothetical protein
MAEAAPAPPARGVIGVALPKLPLVPACICGGCIAGGTFEGARVLREP